MSKVATVASLLLLAWAASPTSAKEKPLLVSTAEAPLRGGVQPASPMLALVLQAMKNDEASSRERLDACVKEHKLKAGNFAPLMRAVRFRSSTSRDRSLWFVRGTTTPYCDAFYGAHVFVSYLIEERSDGPKPSYRLIGSDGADAVIVYPHFSHGYPDAERTICRPDSCDHVRYAYNGVTYHTASCSRTSDDKRGKEVTRPLKCEDADMGWY